MQGHLAGQQDGAPMPVMVVQNSEIREGYLNDYKNNTSQEKWVSVASTAYEQIFSKEVTKEIMDRLSNMVTMPEGKTTRWLRIVAAKRPIVARGASMSGTARGLVKLPIGPRMNRHAT